MEARKDLSQREEEAWRIVSALNFCLAKIVGKYADYPRIDPAVFQKIHNAIREGLSRSREKLVIGDLCQELRSVVSCPVAELLRPSGAEGVDTRITAIAQVVRQGSRLRDEVFRELLTGLLSWERRDKEVILKALTGIIRG
jgi:hypothetical protein